MIQRIELQAHSKGLGMTSQRARDRLVERLREQGIVDENVLNVMRALPRHIFIDDALASRAYEDTALPIGKGQTISQPWVVAKMTEALIAGKMPKKVLEIGTGSGYQTSVLAGLGISVFTVERIDELLRSARPRFRRTNAARPGVARARAVQRSGQRRIRTGAGTRSPARTAACRSYRWWSAARRAARTGSGRSPLRGART